MRLFIPVLIILAIILISGCSYDAPEPITPSPDSDAFSLPVSQINPIDLNHQSWGSWSAVFNLDEITLKR